MHEPGTPEGTPEGNPEGTPVGTPVSTHELLQTVVRMETRLSAAATLPGSPLQAAIAHYRALLPRFEHDLAGDARDVALARSAALMLVQQMLEPAPEPPRKALITDANPTVAEMASRVARWRELVPTADYVDALIPGHERGTYRVIGTQAPGAGSGRPGGAAPPGQAPIPAEHFHLNLVHCAAGKAAPLHSHLTQEVFMPLSGRWEVFWGPTGERALVLEAWDVISLQPGLSRGFRNVGESDAWLLGIAGGADPGMIDWPAVVRRAAQDAGVSLPD